MAATGSYSGGPISIRWTGIDEIIQSLRGVDNKLIFEMEHALEEIGDVVRDDARQRFVAHFADRPSERSAISVERTAAGFQTQVRGVHVGRVARVGVGQKLRKVTGKRPDWGGDMVKFGLLPARNAHQAQAAEMLEAGVFDLLHQHGF